MVNEDKLKNTQAQKAWLWSDCKLVLRRTNPNNFSQQSYENLQAEVQLECEEIQQPFIPILQFQKTLMFNASTGFHWKKGTPLPSLSVKLQESYFQLLKEDQQLLMIYCQITVAYPNRKESHFYLEEIRTLGEKKKKISPEGVVQFKGIIIKESSQQKGNNKFSLLIKICASSIQSNQIILKTLISTAFFVLNSRIRRQKIKKSKYGLKLIDPSKFLKPVLEFGSLSKEFQKQDILEFLKNFNKHNKKLSLLHPLQIIYHCSDALNVYYNSQQVLGLYELLEAITPKVDDQSQLINIKGSFMKLNLKKRKIIRKKSKSPQEQIRQKFIIKTQIKQSPVKDKRKLLMITFNDDLIQTINQINSNNNMHSFSSFFESQFECQCKKLIEIFQKWTDFFLQIDLLKKKPQNIYWKLVQKQTIFEAYKKHYDSTYLYLSKKHHQQVQEEKMEQNVY